MRQKGNSLLCLCGALLLVGALSIPVQSIASPPASVSVQQNDQKAEQRVSGKIVTVRDDGITLEYSDRNGAAKKADFSVDANTKVEGKLEAGAKAEVTYRAENNRLVAVQIVVSAGQ